MAPGFQNEELGDAVAVGGVRSDEARLWMRVRRPGRYHVFWRKADTSAEGGRMTMDVAANPAADNTCSFTIPQDGERLQPLTRYRVRIVEADTDRVIGRARFETAPTNAEQAPEEFSFGVMSCNQPFDAGGRVRTGAREMLVAARRALEQHDCKFLLMMGDQIYSDMPLELSLFDEDFFATVAPAGRGSIHECTVDEVRSLYQARYRHFTSMPAFRELVTGFPVYTILDDHDIVDNWGSDPAHQSDTWRSVGEGARWAYYDYQAGHVDARQTELPTSFHYDMTYGPVSFFVMDLRSERWAESDGGELYSRAQARDLEAFLDRTTDQKVIFLVLSVPPVHLPRHLAAAAARLTPNGEDFSDRWSSLGHVDDRDRFMKRIRAHQRHHPHQRIFFLAGDIHVGCAQEISWDDGGRIVQLVSSGLTNKPDKPIRIGARWLMRLNRSFAARDGSETADVRLLKGVDGRTSNPYAALNIGIVTVKSPRSGGESSIEYRLFGHDEEEPKCVFQSAPL